MTILEYEVIIDTTIPTDIISLGIRLLSVLRLKLTFRDRFEIWVSVRPMINSFLDFFLRY